MQAVRCGAHKTCGPAGTGVQTTITDTTLQVCWPCAKCLPCCSVRLDDRDDMQSIICWLHRVCKTGHLHEEGDVGQRGVVDVLLPQEHIAPRLLELRQIPCGIGLLGQLEQCAWRAGQQLSSPCAQLPLIAIVCAASTLPECARLVQTQGSGVAVMPAAPTAPSPAASCCSSSDLASVSMSTRTCSPRRSTKAC
jgi:hypothetical protein